MSAPAFHNLLEPAGLIRHFLTTPPEGFVALAAADGTPAFSARFDPLTTLDPAVRRKVDALPLARWWRKLLRLQTCFVGTTVSEYALLPRSLPPEDLARNLLDKLAPLYPLLIVKDIPTDAVLVGEAARDYSRRLADACSELGFVLLEGQALAYVAIDFVSIEDFLARMSRSRRRDLRRKLKTMPSLEMQTVPTGDVIFTNEKELVKFYELYLNVYRQSEIQFDLLSYDFFKALLQDGGARGVVFVYRTGGEMIGYNICFIENGVLLDKYIGLLYPQARDHNLYVVSWFHNLQYALTHKLRYYAAGWTDPEVKGYLGASFTMTRHAVYVRNPVLRTVLRSFKGAFETDKRWHTANVSGADS